MGATAEASSSKDHFLLRSWIAAITIIINVATKIICVYISILLVSIVVAFVDANILELRSNIFELRSMLFWNCSILLSFNLFSYSDATGKGNSIEFGLYL